MSRRERWLNLVSIDLMRLTSFGTDVQLACPTDLLDSEVMAFLGDLTEPRSILILLMLARPDFQRNFGDQLHRMLASLRRTTGSSRIETRGGLRGAPKWSETFIRRAAVGNDRTLFVSSVADKTFDTLENRGLISCLRELSDCLSREHRLAARRLPRAVERVKSAVERACVSPSLRDLPSQPLNDGRILGAMRRNKNKGYETILDLTLALRSVANMSDLALASALAGSGWFELVDDDRLFEFVVFFRVVNDLTSVIGSAPKEVRRIGIANGKPVVRYEVEDTKIDVHFGDVPDVLSENSEYITVTKKHGTFFSSRLRRPDIVVVIRTGKITLPLLIEAKNAQGSSAYQRSSVYKCFGYLYDFAEAWREDMTGTRCILAFPGTVPEGWTTSDPLAVVSGDGDSVMPQIFGERIKFAIDLHGAHLGHGKS